MWRSIVLSLGLALAACATGASPPSERESAFITGEDGRTLIHSGSGIRFPQRVAGFVRTDDTVFDNRGEYVGIAYRMPYSSAEEIALRVAVVHIPRMTSREHYVIARPMALRDVHDVRMVAEGDYRRPGGAEGYRGIFEGRKGGRPTMVGFWTFDRGDWDLRARAEFPANRRGEAEEAVGAFVGALRGSQIRETGGPLR